MVVSEVYDEITEDEPNYRYKIGQIRDHCDDLHGLEGITSLDDCFDIVQVLIDTVGHRRIILNDFGLLFVEELNCDV